MRRAPRTDANQAQIVAAFRGLGASVTVLAAVGQGCPDLIVGINRITVPVEVKDGDAALTPEQIEWFNKWRGSKAIVRSLEDVGVLVRAMRGLQTKGGDPKLERRPGGCVGNALVE